MLIIGIILGGMLLGAAAQWLLRGISRQPRDWGEALVAHYGMSKRQAIYFTAHAEADLVQHDDRMGHGPLNRMILQRIIEQGKTARKLGYDPKYCAYTMIDLHALMEQHALENPYPS